MRSTPKEIQVPGARLIYRVKWRHRWSRYNRHFVGIAWYRTNVWSWWAKIYRVLYTTFDMLVCENVCTITSLPTKRISAISQWKTFVRVLPTRWRRKPAGTEITSLSPYVYCLSVCNTQVIQLIWRDLHLWGQKCRANGIYDTVNDFARNFAKCSPILKILSLAEWIINVY